MPLPFVSDRLISLGEANAPPRPPLHSAQDKRNKSAIGGLRRERWGPERMARAELYREFARKCLELAYKVGTRE